jgi:hypothetical protein
VKCRARSASHQPPDESLFGPISIVSSAQQIEHFCVERVGDSCKRVTDGLGQFDSLGEFDDVRYAVGCEASNELCAAPCDSA